MINCVIVDDNELDQLALLSCLKRHSQFRVLGVFSSPEKALPVVENIEVDVLFLDIQMPGMNGLEFRRRIENIPVCIFISSSPDFAVESYELETLDYLLKPLYADRFARTVQRIESFLEIQNKSNAYIDVQNSEKDEFFIKEGKHQLKINLSDIIYLEALKDYTRILTVTGKHMVNSPLGTLIKEPKFNSFIRIHRSYAVPKNAIKRIDRTEVMLENGEKIPVGKTYRDAVLEIIG